MLSAGDAIGLSGLWRNAATMRAMALLGGCDGLLHLRSGSYGESGSHWRWYRLVSPSLTISHIFKVKIASSAAHSASSSACSAAHTAATAGSIWSLA